MTHLNIKDESDNSRLMFTFAVAAVDRGNTQRGERPEDRVVIEFHVCCYKNPENSFSTNLMA